MPLQIIAETAALVVLSLTAKKVDPMQQVLINRVFLIVVTAAATFIATEYPTVHAAICTVG